MKKLVCCLLLGAFTVRAEEPPPPEPTWSLRVHLISDDARVELRRAAASLAAPICKAPCDTELQFRSGEVFTLGGPGLNSSEEFTFRPRDGDVTLQVHAAAQGPRTAGKVLIVLGVLATIGGGAVSDVMQTSCTTGAAGSVCSTQQVAPGVAGGLILGGLVAIVVGAIMVVSSHTTEFNLSP
jgi:hypothetical protein